MLQLCFTVFRLDFQTFILLFKLFESVCDFLSVDLQLMFYLYIVSICQYKVLNIHLCARVFRVLPGEEASRTAQPSEDRPPDSEFAAYTR